MNDVTIPNFGELLGPHLSGVSAGAYPYLLSRLERTAADRYRAWAAEVPQHREALLACAAREDEIADRVEALLPPDENQRTEVEQVIPAARDAYYQVFEGLTPIQQMTIQENAERQGSNAWQNMKAAYPQHADAFDALTALELESADCVAALLQGEA